MSNELHISIQPKPTAPLPSSPTSILPTSTLPPARKLPRSKTLPTFSGESDVIDSATLKSGAVLSGLLASVAAQLLTFFKDDSNFEEPKSNARDAILTLTYISLLSSIIATMASLGFALTRINRDNPFALSSLSAGPMFILWVKNLGFAALSIVISIAVYISMNEQRKTIIAVYVVEIFLSVHMIWFTLDAITTAILSILQSILGRLHVARDQTGREAEP